MNRGIVVAILAALTAGCAVGPDYEKPALETKAAGQWGEASSERVSSQQIQLVQWWTVFKDERLAALIDRAVAANLDLALAESRVREARAEYRAAVGDFLPSVDAAASAKRQRLSEHGAQNVGGFSPPLYSSLYQAGFDAGWEIDVFGGKRRAIEAASAGIEASVEDRRAVLVSLLGEVARNYLVVRGSQRQIAVIRANIRSAGETLELTRTRLRGGLGTDLDVARAEGQLASTSSLIPSLETQLRQAAHRLGLLLGQEPNALKADLLKDAPVPAPPPVVAVGMPS
ncbi:MAG TPA: TolC family protein, partial [Planctomycetota bacterium]|nr:TolC family protein [Planctomycetota bacterium]